MEWNLLKKISYSLRIGIVGSKELSKKIFLESLRTTAIDSDLSNNKLEFLIIHKNIPIKIKVFLAVRLEDLIYNFDRIEKLDVLILTLNLYEQDSINYYNKALVEEFSDVLSFQGLSVLVGMNIEQILNKPPSKSLKISRFHLEKLTRELDLIYCYEIYNNNKDVTDIYNQILNDFIFRFQYSSPDLFEKAKIYGKHLQNEKVSLT
ncbi:hypothetical protein LCGC14_1050650 [marine sediment metagenome]|uniref:Uncharacterized protein n=1 Tax=marine sediment metagenome TaxID=412755 RepID=A0A0F9QUY8_9ZZZZ